MGEQRRGMETETFFTGYCIGMQVKDIQLNCMVNRELTRRVKFGPEVAWASRAVHSDLLLILNLVKSMDTKASFLESAVLSEEDKAKVHVYSCITETDMLLNIIYCSSTSFSLCYQLAQILFKRNDCVQ